MAAQYVTDMTKRPVEMLLGLINADNDFGLKEADVNILAPAPQAADVEGRNTNVDIDLLTLPSEVEGDFVKFEYKRIDLAELFGQFSPSFREVDVALNENGVPADTEAFYAECLRKFGVAMNTEDFEVTLKSAGVLEIAAKVTNLAYVGKFEIMVEASLVSRVATVDLAGFEKPAAEQPAV